MAAPSLASIIERFFQDYADSAEIKQILVDPATKFTQPNQLITKQYAQDNLAAAGAVGPQGPIGHTGVKGDQGDQGVPGPAGLDGADGTNGTSVHYLGSVADAAALPPTGNALADARMTRDDGHLHAWDGARWIDGGRVTGPAGARGPAGSQGDKGDIGDKGDPGAPGPAGADGVTGPKGAQGIQGIQGIKGDQGMGIVVVGSIPTQADLPAVYSGFIGDMFLTVDTGHGWVWEGPKGWVDAGRVQGPDGPKGATGAIGPQGPRGLQGVAGGIGHTGQRGPKGARGADGPAGLDGPAGAHGTGVKMKGAKSDPSQLAVNYAGDVGDMYIMAYSADSWSGHGYMWEGPGIGWVDAGKLQGPVGPRGLRGTTGDTGNTGAKGDQGVPGATGPRGAPGYTHHDQFTDRNAVDSHPRTAISGIEGVFTDRLKGPKTNGVLALLTGSVEGANVNGEHQVNATTVWGGSGHPKEFTPGDDGVLSVRMITTKVGLQQLYQVRSPGHWSRFISVGSAPGPWISHNVYGGTADPPAAADEGSFYIQY